MSVSTATISSRRRCAPGAAAALVDRSRARSLPGNLIAVDDPLPALGALAAFWRSRFDIPVAVVTGSNGKTTTKEMIASIFRAAAGADAVAATPGNFNNAIGLPLALLALRAPHRLAVFEIGMNHRGETRELAAIAQPTIAVITNAQREHQEFMRSRSTRSRPSTPTSFARCARPARRSSTPTMRASTRGATSAARGAARGRHVRPRSAGATFRRAIRRMPRARALELASPLGNAHVLLRVARPAHGAQCARCRGGRRMRRGSDADGDRRRASRRSDRYAGRLVDGGDTGGRRGDRRQLQRQPRFGARRDRRARRAPGHALARARRHG